ncbi:UDP-N-acetylmuramoyl-tripeptide--D-alanyl-D-alanine ligase [Labedella populi]|uniref:UDP-N-acetylmuramoyl-tripeptide--D-alanyl-D-alanine ligase n=1 Tax=Labedella populi TaxID=2498850 RepID=A0A3S4DXF2_9MICO|nr:UDP-N-acetylmuramoyl-tripeptide--D-alanyl-D-alanine ligase [Labedella populi]RWZ61493.1 UDP-N-acetylmuramoyl-tripeptide--D-alanyl-D-alanine ligase [Labedella populi]
MISMTLEEIASVLSGRLALRGDAAATDVVDGYVETDSREIEAGGIFVAKPGETTDGHNFVGVAAERGARLAIVEHEVDEEISQVVVADAVTALGALAAHVVAAVRDRGALRVVGITGSNGKTTTKNLLAAILAPRGETVAPKNSFNNAVGAPTTMLRVTARTEFLVSEMGASGRGQIARLVAMATPDIGVVLKVGLAHAGGFGGIESTFAEKSAMVTTLPSTAVAVLNRDDERVAAMADLTAARVVWFGLDGTADVRATDVEADRTGTRFTVTLPSGESRPVHFKVLGEHHVSNALAAVAVATELGVPIDEIVERLETVTRAERWRMEVLGGRDDVTIINDAYNASPDSMAAALKTLALVTPPDGRRVAVLGTMAELGELAGDEHDRIGLLAVRLRVDRLVVVGRDARRLHISAINEGSWDGESVFVETADEAFAYLEGELRSGDTVLVKSSNSAGLRHLGDRLGELFSW